MLSKSMTVELDEPLAVAEEQRYPGSSFRALDTGFVPVPEAVQGFLANFDSRFFKALARRTGVLRIKISVEWLPGRR